MPGKWGSRLLLLLFGFLLAFLALEGITRLAFPQKKQSDKFWQPDPLLGWANIPNKTGFSRSPEFGAIPVAINSKGLRDTEYDYAKPEGVFRILVLGDSFAQALQVNVEDSFPKLLEALLNKGRSSSVRFEVINAGVNGYGTDQELLFFLREGSKYNPDLVILSFCTINDVMDNSPKLELRDLADRKQFFVLNEGKLELSEFVFSEAPPLDQRSTLRQIVSSILSRSQLYQIIRRSISALTEGKTSIPVQLSRGPNAEQASSSKMLTMPIHYQIYAPQYTPEWEEAWEVTEAIFLELRDEATAQGARLVTLIATTGEELYGEWRHMIPEAWDLDKPSHILSQHLEQNGIAYLPLLPHFRRDFEASGRHLHFRVDGHWTVEGHRLAAEALHSYLAQQEWLP
jgi:lysophospholipase L1-like esterase